MKTAESKRGVVVGIFVLVGIIIAVMGIFALGGQQNRFEKTVTIYAIFDDVEGLRKGNNIWFSGVKVGNVRDIKFLENSQLEVEMKIEDDVQQYIRKDAIVQLGSDGLIGNRILTISGGTTSAPEVSDGDRLVVETPTSTAEMMSSLQKNNENLVSITGNIKELTSGIMEGEGAAGVLFKDDDTANNLKRIMADLERVSRNTAMASAALNQFTAKLNSKDGLVNQMLTDTVVFSKLRASAEQLQETIAAAGEMTKNLSEASQKLNSPDNSLGKLLNDEEFAKKLDNTMNNLESSSEKLDENMEALQHNFLLRGYFRRQAKEEEKANE